MTPSAKSHAGDDEAHEPTFITYAEAAELLGVATSTVSHLIVRRRLTSRGQQGPGVGSLRRDEVESLRRERDEQREAADQRRLERERRPRGPQLPMPPDRDHDWLQVSQAATVVGVTLTAIRQQCARGTLPSVQFDGRWWIRRDHLELRQRARAAQASRQP